MAFEGHLFAGIAVDDLAAAITWYEQLLGSPPSFHPNEKEAVWDLAEGRSIFLEQLPEHAGHARHLIFVEDLDAALAQIAQRGLEPESEEAYDDGVRKVTFRDPSGNAFEFGGAST